MTQNAEDIVELFNGVPDLLCVANYQGFFTFLNNAWTKVLGHPHSILLSQPYISFVHPDDLQKTIEETKALGMNSYKTTSFENRYRKADGSYIWLAWGASSRGGKIFAVAKDVTNIKENEVGELKKLELALRETTLQLSDVLQNSPGMVYQFVLEKSGTMHFPFTSSQTFDIYEIQPEDFKQDPDIMVTMSHPEDREDLLAKIQESALTMQKFLWDGRIITSSGKIKWIKAISVPRKREDGSILWNGIVVDITHETMLQHDLDKQRLIAQHAGRLAAIGELSAGVGHEINNPLTIVLGLIGKAKRLLDSETFSREQLLEILTKQDDACRRIKTIVDGLRTFSRKENEGENPFSDLKEAISSTLSLVSEMYLEQKIAIDSKFPNDECLISCSIAPTQQIIMNTLSNARDAVRGLSNAKISVMVSSHEKFWRVTISDNGYGIPEKIAAKVFDSFFSTKPAGHGTGLGLSLSKTLLDKCGGRISFKSQVNQGATFYLDFPKFLDLSQSKKTQAASKMFTRNLLSVLIVDDEAGILEILADLLGYYGFQVTCSKNALSAIELIRAQEFNLILTDINMPGMDGIHFLGELASQNLAKDASKYLMSGGSSVDSMLRNNDVRLKLIDGFIHKPFSNDELKSMTEKVQARVTRDVA